MDADKGTLPNPPREIEANHLSVALQPVQFSWLWGAGLLVLSLVSLVLLDKNCSGFLRLHPPSGELRKLFDAMEHFGTPYGALLILVTIWIIHPRVRHRLLRTFSAAVAAGLLADIIKLCISRTRPSAFDFDQPAWASFTDVFRWGAGGSSQQGFPSAHTAFAISFAVMLGELFPMARRWFLCLGALVAVQRIASSAHFPSDVLAGAAVGYVTARYYTGNTAIAAICDQFEARLFPVSKVGFESLAPEMKFRSQPASVAEPESIHHS